MNDHEREMWVRNDEGLHYMWKCSRLSMREFLRENRAELTRLINAATNAESGHSYVREMAAVSPAYAASMRRHSVSR